MNMNSLYAVIRTQIARHLTAAVKGRDQVRIDALRAALAALDNATAVPQAVAQPLERGTTTEVARRELTRADITGLLTAESVERLAAAAEYERLGYHERAARLREQAAIIRGTLIHVAAGAGTEAL